MEMSGHIKLWDAPLRLFHWLFAGTVIAAVVTGWVGGNLMPWHGRLGLLVLGLLVFRLIWGFVGSTYARWARIFAATVGVKDYLQGNWREAGHNPLGAFSVLAMLLLVGFQVASGLMATDDIAFQGPLHALVSSETGSALSGLHRQSKWLLLVLIGMHIAAIGYYTLVMRRSLVRAMIVGRAQRAHESQQDARGGSTLAAALAITLAAGCVWGVQSAGDWIRPEPAAEAPSLDW
ncbi:cytochrome B [Pseudomonas stutzeri]|uniref:cytochrome b/b6 domain-containing protein n=1 Tax=Stutzerimonas stutzeri TaxID=316 RepID=UPI00190D0FE1|nr:cytochrome b/b6 domain-containing protein [Stutzerimonas stutzeri]MBK3869233.1 cytochrome B [Stutzerimonas stutzeri]